MTSYNQRQRPFNNRAFHLREIPAFELSESQKRELDRRLETASSNAAQGAAFGRTWEEIKAEFTKSR